MYKLINQIIERQPLVEPLGLRTKTKEVMRSNIFRSLLAFFDELVSISQACGEVEVSGIALINRFTGEIIAKMFRAGTENECAPPTNFRTCIRPNIIQVLAHNHPNGVCCFSEQDEEVIHFRFNTSILGLGVVNAGIDDESYVVTYDREDGGIKFKGKQNRLW
ncbi:MAG: hypothetical protein ABSB28_10645 [Candidatus Bathyarchaeia archaeon]